MNNTIDLNRLEYNILKCLYEGGCKNQYHSMTITELLKYDEDLLGVRMTVYKKLSKLVKAGYIKKGITDNHADTFYLLEKGIKIVEGKGTNVTKQELIQNRNKSKSISYEIDTIRINLVKIINQGLLLKAIAVNAGLSESELSRFKNGVNSLKQSDLKILAEYLDAVVIPQWATIIKEPEKQISMRERLLESRNGNIQNTEKKKSTMDWLFM